MLTSSWSLTVWASVGSNRLTLMRGEANGPGALMTVHGLRPARPVGERSG